MPVFAITIEPPSAGLPAGVEHVRGEVRLAPRYPWSGGDIDFSTVVPSGDPSGWTAGAMLSGAMSSRDVAATRPGFVTWNLTGASASFSGNSPSLRRTVTGDFDVFAELRFGARGAPATLWLYVSDLAQSNTRHIGVGTDNPSNPCQWRTATVAGSGSAINVGSLTYQAPLRQSTFVRLARVGSTITPYTSHDLLTWTSRSFPALSPTIPSTAYVGFVYDKYSTDPAEWVQFGPIRSWPPLIASAPQVVREIDSGKDGSVWNLGTFAERSIDEQSRAFSVAGANPTYAYAVGNSPGAGFAASGLSLSQLRAVGDQVGRYLRLGVSLPSSGVQDTRWAGATMSVTVSMGSGGVSLGRVVGGL